MAEIVKLKRPSKPAGGSARHIRRRQRPQLAIQSQHVGSNGLVVLTVMLGGDRLATEKIDILRPKARTEFIDRLCKGHRGIKRDRKTVEQDLLRIAGEVAERLEEMAKKQEGNADLVGDSAELPKAVPQTVGDEVGAMLTNPAVTAPLTLTPRFTGSNGAVTMTAMFGEETFTDTLNITRAKDRVGYRDRIVARWPAVPVDQIDQQLEKIAAEHVNRTGSQPVVDGPELDLSRLVRLERFITPSVSGLALPMIVEIDGQPVGKWVLMLQWADGRRETVDLTNKLALPDGGCLWISPVPAEPIPSTARTLAGWSVASRRAWLGGSPPPDPADLFKRLCERFAYFLHLPDEDAAGTTATLALWAMLTYIYPAWDAIPYLYIGGAWSSGKSRVFEIQVRLVFRPFSSSNITAPTIFRTLHDRGGVLLLDEAERLRQPTPETGEILSMLLAGYKKGGQATRLEPVDDTFKTVAFDVFGPKALACIAGVPPALASRCIPITMFRAPPGSPKPRRRIDADPAVWQRLRDDLFALALTNGATWLDLAARADVVPEMSGRDFELWQPLMALAGWIEGHGADGLLKLVQDHASKTIEAGQDEKTPEADEVLLRLLAEKIRGGGQPEAKEILSAAKVAEPDIFQKWTPQGVGRTLSRYKFKTKPSHGRRIYRVELDALRQVERSYGIDLGLPPLPLENVTQHRHPDSLDVVKVPEIAGKDPVFPGATFGDVR